MITKNKTICQLKRLLFSLLLPAAIKFIVKKFRYSDSERIYIELVLFDTLNQQEIHNVMF